MSEHSISINLTPDEALVLFEFVWRYSEEDRLAVIDQAEQRVLWDLCCMLEGHPGMRAINNPEYERQVAEARRRLRDPADDAPASG
jgi:hypothetical protein